MPEYAGESVGQDTRKRNASVAMSWIAGASVYSGRPDPTWPITDELAARLEEVWSSLPASDAPAPSPPPLGYRGCFVISSDGRRWSAHREWVRLEASGSAEVRHDEARAFENLVLGSAPDGVLPRWAFSPEA